jgi:hypothetical protein
MAFVRFKHQDGRHDMVRVTGFQVCLDRGKVNEFYRPSEGTWIDPLNDPIRKRPDKSIPITFDNRRTNDLCCL